MLVLKQRCSQIRCLLLSVFISYLLIACEDGSDAGHQRNSNAVQADLNLPESLTGPRASVGGRELGGAFARDGGDDFDCAYTGPENEEIFRNGYNMSKFMLSAVGTWTCIGDRIVEISVFIPDDGKVYETEHDGAAVDYDPSEPSHYRLTRVGDNKFTLHLYYSYAHGLSLPSDAQAGFYYAWLESDSKTTGRMIIDTQALDGSDPEDPVKTRMDFEYGDTQKKVDMYFSFDENNNFSDGFRIQVTKDLQANSDEHVFTAISKLNMIEQFEGPISGVSEIPVIDVFTVSNASGDGAALAEISDLAFPLEIDVSNHLGNYISNKVDTYVFDAQSNWEWIYKTFDSAELRGSDRNVSSITLDLVESLLGLGGDYFDNFCDVPGADCTDFINAVYDLGEYDQEGNQGSDPGDWRSNAISASSQLDSVYPEGFSTWEGVFEFDF